MKKYKLALILGRFQILHNGHLSIINKGLELADEVMILIGSADKKDTYANPFSYQERKANIEAYYHDKVKIFPLDDLGVGNVPLWGDYVISKAKEYLNEPDLIIYGNESKCREWYKNYPHFSYCLVDRGQIAISTTLLKEVILKGDYETFCKYTPECIHSQFDQIKEKLLEVKDK